MFMDSTIFFFFPGHQVIRQVFYSGFFSGKSYKQLAQEFGLWKSSQISRNRIYYVNRPGTQNYKAIRNEGYSVSLGWGVQGYKVMGSLLLCVYDPLSTLLLQLVCNSEELIQLLLYHGNSWFLYFWPPSANQLSV